MVEPEDTGGKDKWDIFSEYQHKISLTQTQQIVQEATSPSGFHSCGYHRS